MRLGRLEGVVSHRARPQSSVVDVAAVGRQIAGLAWSAASPTVRLSGIDWRVLDVVLGKSGHRALLLADRVIATGPYDQKQVDATWERCDLRRWLNDDFAWSLGEPLTSRALQTRVRNGPNPTWGTDSGKDTTDRFFLLSVEEAAERLVGEKPDWKDFKQRRFESDALIAKDEEGNGAWWWLRSPGLAPDFAARVRDDGILRVGGDGVSWSSGGVRPAFWLNLES